MNGKYIYVAESETGYIKIGASQDPEFRLVGLRSTIGPRFKMVSKYFHPHAERIETIIHGLLSEFRSDVVHIRNGRMFRPGRELFKCDYLNVYHAINIAMTRSLPVPRLKKYTLKKVSDLRVGDIFYTCNESNKNLYKYIGLNDAKEMAHDVISVFGGERCIRRFRPKETHIHIVNSIKDIMVLDESFSIESMIND